MAYKHGKKKKYVILHFALDVESKEVVAMKISTDDMHYDKAFPSLFAEVEKKRRIARVWVTAPMTPVLFMRHWRPGVRR